MTSLIWLFLFAFILPSYAANQANPFAQCQNYKNINNWTQLQKDCLHSNAIGSTEVWDWGTAPSSFALTEFLINKITVETAIRAVNTSLEYVYWRSLAVLGRKNGTIEIRSNPRLFYIEFAHYNPNSIHGDLILEENPNLSKLTHNILSKWFPKGKIAPFGECRFRNSFIGNLTDLTFKRCKSVIIEGDLVIEGGNEFFGTDAVIKRIDGCLILKETQLTGIDFLQLEAKGSSYCKDNRKSEIRNNPSLCVSRNLTRTLPFLFSGIVITNNEKCEHICTAAEVLIEGVRGCRVITDDLVIDIRNHTNRLPQLNSIEELQGRLVIRKTGYSSIQFLKNLKRIYSSSLEPTVEVVDNAHLLKLNLSSLEIIASPADLILMSMKNHRYILTPEEHDHWLSLAHGETLRVNSKVLPKKKINQGMEIAASAVGCTFAGVFLIFVLLTSFGIRPDRRNKDE